jgi:hypothetical protein
MQTANEIGKPREYISQQLPPPGGGGPMGNIFSQNSFFVSLRRCAQCCSFHKMNSFHHVFFVFVMFLLVPVLSAVTQFPAGQLAVGLKTEH